MLKLGEKGAIPQRDGQTYAVAPHIPCGLITPELLRRLADVAEKYQAKAVKITGATRAAIIGLKKDGWALVIGGNVGAEPRIGQEIADKLDDAAALAAIEKVIAVYTRDANKGERLGKMIDRAGIEPFKSALA
jgi:NAD(P)H-nitrite reductase large subunit